MRLVSFLIKESSGGVVTGIERDGKYVPLYSLTSSLPRTMLALLAKGEKGLASVRRAAEKNRGNEYGQSEVQLLPPVPDPKVIWCVGINYDDHAVETGNQVPEVPVLFSKFPYALAAHGDEIVLPPISNKVDYEAELVYVIGPNAKIIGCTCGHDVSARDWQLDKPGGQWLRGKTFRTFAPTGPAIVTLDEVGDPHALRIQMRLNGKTMQDSNTQHLHHRGEALIAHLLQFGPLEPGALVFTGTPGGVGMARKPEVFLKPGDVCEVEIKGIGVLRNPVVQG